MREVSEAERALATALSRTVTNRRRELGKTQEQVANSAGIDRKHYQLLEHARSDRKSNYPANPQLSTIIRLAAVLELSEFDLLKDALAAYHATRKAAS